MLKKAITFVIILIMLIEFLPYNSVMAKNMTAFDNLDEGRAIKGGKQAELPAAEGTSAATYTTVSGILSIIPRTIQALLTLVVMPHNATKISIFTIEDLLLGRFELFDVDFMNTASVTGKNAESYVTSEINPIIKENVAGWFVALRRFSIVALLAILIIIGILMAISSIADDRAKYKQMLINWGTSFTILMILPYVMAICFTISNSMVDIIRGASEAIAQNQTSNSSVEQTDGLNFEKTIIFGKVDKNGNMKDGQLQKIQKSTGTNSLALTLVYMILVYYEVKFFFLYIRRFMTIGFLVAIAPLITITYSIDKAQDNQAQAFRTWIKEFFVNVFIQPLHALLFVIFIGSVYGIIELAPLLAIIFLAALSRGEQLVRTIFKIERTTAMGFLRRGKR